MGLIETCLRSATAVAMVDGTKLQEIGEEEFYDFLQHNPERLLQIIRQMRTRIRENTEKYQDTCCTLLTYQKAEENGQANSADLDQQLQKISSTAKKGRQVILVCALLFFTMCWRISLPMRGNGSPGQA